MTLSVDVRKWSRIAAESAGYAFVAWAVLVACNVYGFVDPASRTAAGNDVSHLPQILTHVPRNAALVLGLLFTLGAVIAPGDAVLRLFRLPVRDVFDRIAFGVAAGLALLMLVAYFLAAVQLLRWQVEAALLVAGFVFSVIAIRRWIREAPLVPDTVRTPRALVVILWILLGATLYVGLLAALTPEVGFDARYYHLAEAQRYAQHGGFYNLVESERMWAYAVPHYQETLYAFEWVLFGAIGAKLTAWGGAIAIVLALVAFSRAWFASTAVGVLAATIVFASPVVLWSATTANNDLAPVPFAILALHALMTWRATLSRAALCAAGAFAGITYGIKPFGAFAIVALAVIIGATLLTRRAARKVLVTELAVFAGCAVLTLLPALVTSAWMIGDPFYPIAARLFPTRFGAGNVGTLLSSIVAADRSSLTPVAFVSLPWTMTVDTLRGRDLLGPIWLTTLPLWVAVPFIARAASGVVRALAVFAVVYVACDMLSGAIEFRYVITAAPIVALLLAYGLVCLDWSRARSLQAVMIASVAVFAALDNPLLARLEWNASSPSVMGPAYLNWDYVYGDLPESSVQLQYVPMLQYTNAHLDFRRDKIYDGVYLEVMNLYSEIPLFNGTSYDGPTGLNEWTLSSPDAYARLRAAGCTYVIVAKDKIAVLKRAPVWRHLKFVVETRSMNGPATMDELFAVVD